MHPGPNLRATRPLKLAVPSEQPPSEVLHLFSSFSSPHLHFAFTEMYCLNTGRKVVARQKVPSNMLVNLTCQMLTLIDMSQACCLKLVIWLSLSTSQGDSVKEVCLESNFLQIHLKTKVSIYSTFWGCIISY